MPLWFCQGWVSVPDVINAIAACNYINTCIRKWYSSPQVMHDSNQINLLCYSPSDLDGTFSLVNYCPGLFKVNYSKLIYDMIIIHILIQHMNSRSFEIQIFPVLISWQMLQNILKRGQKNLDWFRGSSSYTQVECILLIFFCCFYFLPVCSRFNDYQLELIMEI